MVVFLSLLFLKDHRKTDFEEFDQFTFLKYILNNAVGIPLFVLMS
jgi:hypothetical protein